MTEASAEEHGWTLERLCTEINSRRHMVVVANRGPISFRPSQAGGVSAGPSGGINIAALEPLADLLPLTWVALASNDADLTAARSSSEGVVTGAPLPGEWGARFAEASRRVNHRHYNLICNPLLWFLHHRVWGPSHTPNIDAVVVDAWNNGHVPVTLAYLAEIEAEAGRTGKRLLVNTRDYTLTLLPGLVRSRLPGSLIVHSSDVPWPGPDWWLFLPKTWRESIVRSLLACDLIAFPSARDIRAFTASASEFGPDVNINGDGSITTGDHTVAFAVSPSGLDPDGLGEFAGSSRVASEARRMGAEGVHTFATVERAEPHKNIPRSLRAFGRLLVESPELAGRVRYLLVLAPPPPHLSQYRRYVDEIKSEVRALNRQFGGDGYSPVELHLERNYAKAIASMSICDTLVSVPIADGSMGSAADSALVNRRNGSLIVSETSPAADRFGGMAEVVSPADIDGMTKAMQASVSLNLDERADAAERRQAAAAAWTRESALTAELSPLADKL